MKKTIILAIVCAMYSINTSKADEPKSKINIDESCPASVSVNIISADANKQTGTRTENNSKGYDARTTVTDNNGFQTTYHTAPQSTTNQSGGTFINGHTNRNIGDNSNVSRVDVFCSPVEK